MADSGKIRKIKKTQFIVFCQPYKTPNGSKKKRKSKRDGGKSTALLEAPARRFIRVGESDVGLRPIQDLGSEARGEGRERG